MIYISAPYSAETAEQIQINVQCACVFAKWIRYEYEDITTQFVPHIYFSKFMDRIDTNKFGTQREIYALIQCLDFVYLADRVYFLAAKYEDMSFGMKVEYLAYKQKYPLVMERRIYNKIINQDIIVLSR